MCKYLTQGFCTHLIPTTSLGASHQLSVESSIYPTITLGACLIVPIVIHVVDHHHTMLAMVGYLNLKHFTSCTPKYPNAWVS